MMSFFPTLDLPTIGVLLLVFCAACAIGGLLWYRPATPNRYAPGQAVTSQSAATAYLIARLTELPEDDDYDRALNISSSDTTLPVPVYRWNRYWFRVVSATPFLRDRASMSRNGLEALIVLVVAAFAAGLVFKSLLIGAATVVALLWASSGYLYQADGHRERKIAEETTSFILGIKSAVQSGMSIEGAFIGRVADLHGPLREELTPVIDAVNQQVPFTTALTELFESTPSPTVRQMTRQIIPIADGGTESHDELEEVALWVSDQVDHFQKFEEVQVMNNLFIKFLAIYVPSILWYFYSNAPDFQTYWLNAPESWGPFVVMVTLFVTPFVVLRMRQDAVREFMTPN